MILSHDGLELFTGLLTIGSGGWVAYAKLTQSRLEEKIRTNEEIIKVQWQRIDDIKEKAAKKEELDEWRHKTQTIEREYISREYHDKFRIEFKDDMEKAIASAMQPLIVEVRSLSDHVNKLNGKSA